MHNHLSKQISSPKLYGSLGCSGALYQAGEQIYLSSYYTIIAPTLHKDLYLYSNNITVI
jgi:hypothetical protein